MTGPAQEYADLLARAAPFLHPTSGPDAGAGYGVAVVTGDVWLRERADAVLAGLPELPLDDDGMVDALVVALAELDDGVGLRAWDPGKHPRGPGGRFRATVDVLKERIQKHRRGDGEGDPFDGYSREQLRKAAKARGIELKRGENRDSIAARLLADLGGKQGSSSKKTASTSPGATPETPKATATVAAAAPKSSSNPAELSGPGPRWWSLLREDTGPDDPVPVRDLNLGSGYTVRSGKAFRVDGVAILVEDGTSPTSQVVRDFMDVHRELPANAGHYQRGYAWLAGSNPDDAFWERKYKIPGFASGATAGDGSVTMWRKENAALGPYSYRDTLAHEFGHNVSARSVSRDLDDRGAAWEQAAEHDAAATRPTDVSWTAGPMVLRAHTFNFAYAPGKDWPRGVTQYGTSSPAEDYAESVSFYIAGQIGTGRLQLGGPKKPIYFRDLFPARAAVLDQVFPEIAASQQAAVRAR